VVPKERWFAAPADSAPTPAAAAQEPAAVRLAGVNTR
jgi:hypothetical protein